MGSMGRFTLSVMQFDVGGSGFATRPREGLHQSSSEEQSTSSSNGPCLRATASWPTQSHTVGRLRWELYLGHLRRDVCIVQRCQTTKKGRTGPGMGPNKSHDSG